MLKAKNDYSFITNGMRIELQILDILFYLFKKYISSYSIINCEIFVSYMT